MRLCSDEAGKQCPAREFDPMTVMTASLFLDPEEGKDWHRLALSPRGQRSLRCNEAVEKILFHREDRARRVVPILRPEKKS